MKNVDEQIGDGGSDDELDYLDDEEMDDEYAQTELRWEKGVEFSLARELQAWHIVSQTNFIATALSKKDGRIKFNAILDTIDQRSREPRYLPLDGNAERTLGDALAGTEINKLLLVECKALLDGSGWSREAKPEIRKPATKASNKGKDQIINPGGKNRHATLNAIGDEIWDVGRQKLSVKELGHKCHVLIGNGKAAAADDPSTNGLVFTGYWNFIFRPSQGKDVLPDSFPILELKKWGLEIEKFRYYIYSLLEQDLASSVGDAAWIGREMILLAYGGDIHLGSDSCIGGRILASDLAKVLDLDAIHKGLMEKLIRREKAERSAKKLKNLAKQKQNVAANGAVKKGPGKKN